MSPLDEYVELITTRHGDNHRKIAENLALFDAYDASAQSVMILMEHARHEITRRWHISNALRSISV